MIWPTSFVDASWGKLHLAPTGLICNCIFKNVFIRTGDIPRTSSKKNLSKRVEWVQNWASKSGRQAPMFMDNKAETQMFTPFAHTPRIEHNEHNVRAMSAPMSPNNVFFMTSSFAAKVMSTHSCFFGHQIRMLLCNICDCDWWLHFSASRFDNVKKTREHLPKEEKLGLHSFS